MKFKKLTAKVRHCANGPLLTLPALSELPINASVHNIESVGRGRLLSNTESQYGIETVGSTFRKAISKLKRRF